MENQNTNTVKNFNEFYEKLKKKEKSEFIKEVSYSFDDSQNTIRYKRLNNSFSLIEKEFITKYFQTKTENSNLQFEFSQKEIQHDES